MANSEYDMDEARPMFYIGEHASKRTLSVTTELVHHAQDLGVSLDFFICAERGGVATFRSALRKEHIEQTLIISQYDMLTTPITNDHFHSRVLSLLSSYTQATEESTQAQPLPLIPALENFDTPLLPDHLISQLVAFTSSWIDLSSPDPIIAHLSRQVFNLEVAYAAFCGVVTLVVPGPRLANGTKGVAQYARSIKEALSTGAYVQFHVLMPMDTSTVPEEEDVGHLARFVRPEFAEQSAKSSDLFGSWDAWDSIRSICKYNTRLSVGKQTAKSHCGLSTSDGLERIICSGDKIEVHRIHTFKP